MPEQVRVHGDLSTSPDVDDKPLHDMGKHHGLWLRIRFKDHEKEALAKSPQVLVEEIPVRTVEDQDRGGPKANQRVWHKEQAFHGTVAGVFGEGSEQKIVVQWDEDPTGAKSYWLISWLTELWPVCYRDGQRAFKPARFFRTFQAFSPEDMVCEVMEGEKVIGFLATFQGYELKQSFDDITTDIQLTLLCFQNPFQNGEIRIR